MMRKKRRLYGSVVLAAIGVATAIGYAAQGATPDVESTGIGRYQLVTGSFYHFIVPRVGEVPNERHEQVATFLVDTVTGEVWTYYQSNVQQGWLPTGGRLKMGAGNEGG